MGNESSCNCTNNLKDEKSTEVILEDLRMGKTDLRSTSNTSTIKGFHCQSDYINEKFDDCSFVRNSEKNFSNIIDQMDPETDRMSFINYLPSERNI